MHTCLIVSLHGVVVFFVIIECADKYMCRCNNGESSKLHTAHAAPQYITTVVQHVLETRVMADENTSSRGDWPIQSKYRSTVADSLRVPRSSSRAARCRPERCRPAGRWCTSRTPSPARSSASASAPCSASSSSPPRSRRNCDAERTAHDLVTVQQFTYVSCVV